MCQSGDVFGHCRSGMRRLIAAATRTRWSRFIIAIGGRFACRQNVVKLFFRVARLSELFRCRRVKIALYEALRAKPATAATNTLAWTNGFAGLSPRLPRMFGV